MDDIDLKNLTREQKRSLLRDLLTDPEACGIFGARLPLVELGKAENWFRQRIAGAKNPLYKTSRVRMWFIFMLLRHAGLRLPEIFALSPQDLDLRAGIVAVTSGPAPREVPLPEEVARQMLAAWLDWPHHDMARPFLCDASQIRRTFNDCERACGLNPGLINARSMRRNRGREMELAGAHPELIDIFMGRTALVDKANGELLRQFIQRGPATSARNVFAGHVTDIQERGILVRVRLMTPSGMAIHINITDTSRKNLNLAVGVRARALIKAPLVTLLPQGVIQPPGVNLYNGRVASMRQDALVREILVKLDDGSLVCALCPSPPKLFNMRPDTPALVHFCPYSVILNRDF